MTEGNWCTSSSEMTLKHYLCCSRVSTVGWSPITHRGNGLIMYTLLAAFPSLSQFSPSFTSIFYIFQIITCTWILVLASLLIESNQERGYGASLVVQWLRIHLPMQGTRVQALVWEDPTWRGATKPVHHNYWACALEPTSHNYWACVPQLLKLMRLQPVLRNKRCHCNEKPTYRNEE